jgi:uncharacterized damage-inducible protein DinB
VTFIRIGTVYTPPEIRYNPRIMAKSEPLDILLPFDQWATAQVLDACAKLTDEQWHQKYEIGPGSLHAAVTHILGAIQTWTAVLADRQPGPRVEEDGQRRSPAELQELLNGASRELAEQARRRPLGEMVTRQRQGKTIQLTRGSVLMQVLTHGVHHRAQCLNMLRRLGVTPLPPSSVTEWAIRVDLAG